jgi:hypothetical protein
MGRKGNQDEYNKLLNGFSAKTKTKSESVEHLMKLGFFVSKRTIQFTYFEKGARLKLPLDCQEMSVTNC